MNSNDISEKLHYHSGYRIVAHLLFWTLLVLIGWYNMIISFNSYTQLDTGPKFLLALSNVSGQALVYYPLVYLMMPKFFGKGKFITGIVSILLLIVGYTFINVIIEATILHNCKSCMNTLKMQNTGYYEFLQRGMLNRMLGKLLSFGIVLGLIFSISIPLCIKFALQAFRQQIEAVKLAKQNVELEFNFLKSQVNPHFLFNSLNNIYGLILKKDTTKAADVVARLSEFMRYTLYHSSEEKMALEKEIQLIKDYIELESIRLNYTKVNCTFDIDDYSIPIPSLLLMPVIENAFKYSADSAGEAIDIVFVIQAKKLIFRITNAIDEDRQLQHNGGIGLQNFKKRLQLYYPEKHMYEVSTTDSKYSVKLMINL